MPTRTAPRPDRSSRSETLLMNRLPARKDRGISRAITLLFALFVMAWPTLSAHAQGIIDTPQYSVGRIPSFSVGSDSVPVPPVAELPDAPAPVKIGRASCR